MHWLRLAAQSGPLGARWAAFSKKAARAARRVVHIVALVIVLDAALRLVIGRRDLLGIAVLAFFLASAIVIGLIVRAREPHLRLRAHVDDVALGLAALILEYFVLATASAKF